MIKKIKSIVITSTLIIGATINSRAQNLIAVQNGGTQTFYSSLDTAITYCQNGDTIYIPGGAFSLTVSINKQIHIIGVGHNPDSSTASNITLITGNVTLNKNSSGGSLSGVNCSNIELSPGYTDTILNYSISRCNFNMINYYGYYIGNNYGILSNCFFRENVIRDKIFIRNSLNNLFSNNIIAGISIDGANGPNNNFSNNIFLRDGSSGSGIVIGNSLIENNVFVATIFSISNVTNSIINNNLFVTTIRTFFKNANTLL